MGESLDKAKERTKHLKDREILELILAEIYNVKEGGKIISNQIDILQEEIDDLIENVDSEEDDYENYGGGNEKENNTDIEDLKEELKKDTKKQIKKEREKYEQERKRKEFRENLSKVEHF